MTPNTYRYSLTRNWTSMYVKGHNKINFIMLNPSTADAVKDDPTIRKCMGFAQRWGYNELVVTNLFAYRATHPEDLRLAYDRGVNIIGDDNPSYLLHTAITSDLVVCAWGVNGDFLHRDAYVVDLLGNQSKPLHCICLTKSMFPQHPLMAKYTTEPKLWS